MIVATKAPKDTNHKGVFIGKTKAKNKPGKRA